MGTQLKTALTGICLTLQIYLSAQDKSEVYIKGSIPDSLKKDADAVCRLDEQDVELLSTAKVIVRERHIYTILNNGEEGLARYRTGYDKLTSINYVNGTLYDAQGKELNHFKKKDMSDFTNEGEAFVSDERVKESSFNYNSYPYSVAFEEEDEKSGSYDIPQWEPPRTEKMSLQISRYVLTIPADYKIRLKMLNMDLKPVVTQKKDKITYTWEVRNLPVIPDEPLGIDYPPFLLVGPTDFELESYKGNISTWQDYGKFYAALYKGRDILPDDLKQQVHKLTDNVQDPYKKIALLYDYLQKNTHYVLIMFGIGGLQPYDAAYVAKNKYGDCKALSNFMVALLKEAGIKGYPVAIWGGKETRDFITDFPSHQSNHIICAVPVEKDTVWLECTSQSLPPGYLSDFTANRYGLLFDENGGKLVHTPAYLLNDNTSICNLHATLDAEGNLQIKNETSYKAVSCDPIQDLIHNYSKTEQLDYLKRSLDLPTYTINAYNCMEDNSSRLPVIHEFLDISVTNYAHLTGKRIFFVPNILRRSKINFPEGTERKMDFEFKNDYREIDTVSIAIPAGYTPEAQPKDISLQTNFGKFQIRTIISGDKVTYYRQLDRYRGRFQASKFNEIREFYNSVYEADRSQIVLVKK
jgi:hypothetical protein